MSFQFDWKLQNASTYSFGRGVFGVMWCLVEAVTVAHRFANRILLRFGPHTAHVEA